jgi:hypothetical protein
MARLIKHLTVLVLTGILMQSCGSSKSEAQKLYNLNSYRQTKDLVLSGEFDFLPTACYPLQTNAVEQASNNLFRNTNNVSSRRALTNKDGFFRMRLDTVACSLPYIGEFRSTNFVTNQNAGINFNDLVKSYKVKTNDGKQTIYISFQVKNKVESFNVNLEISKDKTAMLNIYSISRSPIRYLGSVAASQQQAVDK